MSICVATVFMLNSCIVMVCLCQFDDMLVNCMHLYCDGMLLSIFTGLAMTVQKNHVIDKYTRKVVMLSIKKQSSD